MSQPSKIWQVGDLRIDVAEQRLERAGQAIPLPPLSFNALLALVQAAPRFVSNDELMTQVWSGQVVSLETVTQRIKLLRDAIQDDPRQPRYIEGQRGRGYRCIAAVNPGSLPPVPEDSAARDRRKTKWAAVVLGIVVLGAGGLWLLRRSAPVVGVAAGLSHTVPPAVGSTDSTVAVQPFLDLSANKSDAYLAVGLPDMILNRLSGTPGLTVISRESSFAQSAAVPDVRALGARLHAHYLVTGSVQRTGQTLHVTVRLLETAEGKQLWSARYDRRVEELFALEDDMNAALTAALADRSQPTAPKTRASERSRSIDAYLAYLQGRALLGRYGVADTDAAAPHFEQAIKLDPEFAVAYAALYDARMQSASLQKVPLVPIRTRYQPLIDRALAIDPGCGTAYYAQAMWATDDIAQRKRLFERAMAADPSNGRGLTAYAEFLENDANEHDAASLVLARALQIDPMSPRAHFANAIRSLDSDGFVVVEQEMLKVLELDPNFVPALQRYGKYRWELHGELAEGIQLIEHAIRLDPTNPWLRHTATAIYLDLDDPDAAADVSAGAPQSVVSGPLLLSLYRGDWRAAGLAARDPSGWFYSPFENWGAGEALRDYALRTGDFATGAHYLSDKFGLSVDAPPQIGLENFRQAVYLSQVLAAQGRQRAATTLREAAAAWNDANQGRYGPLYARRTRATLLMIAGKQDAALDELAGSFQSLDYLHWWYTLRWDPVWVPLHTLPRFQAIQAEVTRYVAQQRAQLDALRRTGAIPVRPTHAVHR